MLLHRITDPPFWALWELHHPRSRYVTVDYPSPNVEFGVQKHPQRCLLFTDATVVHVVVGVTAVLLAEKWVHNGKIFFASPSRRSLKWHLGILGAWRTRRGAYGICEDFCAHFWEDFGLDAVPDPEIGV